MAARAALRWLCFARGMPRGKLSEQQIIITLPGARRIDFMRGYRKYPAVEAAGDLLCPRCRRVGVAGVGSPQQAQNTFARKKRRQRRPRPLRWRLARDCRVEDECRCGVQYEAHGLRAVYCVESYFLSTFLPHSGGGAGGHNAHADGSLPEIGFMLRRHWWRTQNWSASLIPSVSRNRIEKGSNVPAYKAQ